MKQDYAILYEKAYRNFTLGILCIILASYIVGGFLYELPQSISYLFLAGAIFNLAPIVVVCIVPMVYIKKITKVYLVIVMTAIFILTIMSLLKGVMSPLFWYIAIPIYVYVAFPGKEVVKCSVVYLVLMLLAYVAALVLRCVVYDNSLIDYPPLSLYQMTLTEIVNAVFALALVCHSLFYEHRFRTIQVAFQEQGVLNIDDELSDSFLLLNEKDDCKYEDIYNQIEEYFELKQPYLNPDFRIAQMAYELNVNAVYLAKSIRMKKGLNFNNLINQYRISKVKEMMHSNSSKYTFEYIYLSSGFKSQTSFNRAFKQEMGITPSEYFKKITDKKDSIH